jgi:hypothetical protein
VRQAADQLGYDRPEDVDRWLSPPVRVRLVARRMLGWRRVKLQSCAAGTCLVVGGVRIDQGNAIQHSTGRPA